MLVNFTYLFYFFDLFFFCNRDEHNKYCILLPSFILCILVFLFFFAILLSVVGITTVDDPKIVILGIEFGR